MKQSGKHSSASDKFLVEQCLMQDPNAWATLASLVRDLAIKSLLGRYPWSPQDIDDVVQQTNLALVNDDFRILRSYDAKRARLQTYLAGVLDREAQHYVRRHFRHPKVPLENLSIKADEQWEETLARIDVWEQIQQTLSFTDVLILRFTAERYRAKEIADILARGMGRPMTEANVRQRRKRAYHRLKTRLGEKFFS